ncbi:hypothetical protein [Streptomyces sp. NPDC002790]
MEGVLSPGGQTLSHEAVYAWIQSPPKDELACHGTLLPSGSTRSVAP